MTPSSLDGLVLCRAGEGRFALDAQEVVALDDSEREGHSAPYAGRGFVASATHGTATRIVYSEDGRLVVDGVEIFTERVKVMGVPYALSSVGGGALEGFVEAAGGLWPLVSLGSYARFLERGS